MGLLTIGRCVHSDRPVRNGRKHICLSLSKVERQSIFVKVKTLNFLVFELKNEIREIYVN
jgi:hypothetical protein